MYQGMQTIMHGYRSKWQNSIGNTINWKKSFCDIQKGKNNRKANDLRWKIVHLCIPTAVRLAGRNTYFDLVICQMCEAYPETISHLFFYCEQSKKIWDFASQIIRIRFPSLRKFHFQYKEIIFGFNVQPELNQNPIASVLHDLGLRTIWTSRNRLIYEKEEKDIY